MIGERESPGLIPRFLADLFAKKAELSDEAAFELRYSFFEIYKEKIFDALEPGDKPLVLREQPGKEVFIEGLGVKKVTSLAEALSDLGAAVARRRASETFLNGRSSRSHFIASIDVSMVAELPTDNASCAVTKRSRITFVDLAGSEKQSHNLKEALLEGCAINRSLSVLAHVVGALSRKSPAFLHFRDSKLTHYLKDCFAGNAHIAIIANVLPQKEYLAETLSTLSFVSMAQKVRIDPHINVETTSGPIAAGQMSENCQKVIDELSNIKKTVEEKEILSKVFNLYSNHLASFTPKTSNSELIESTVALHSSALPLLEQIRTTEETKKTAILQNLIDSVEKLLQNLTKIEQKEDHRSFLSEQATVPSFFHTLPEMTKTLPHSKAGCPSPTSASGRNSFTFSKLAAQKATISEEIKKLENLRMEIVKQKDFEIEALRQLVMYKTCECSKTKKPEEPPSVASLNKKIVNLERQLRNRNKDYLFALKEVEKLKMEAIQPYKISLVSSFQEH